MDTHARPFRSVLYIPASKARALEKARGLATDAIIFDLEDAVAVEEKAAARGTLAEALAQEYGARFRIVRINGLDTEWGREDAAMVGGADAVLLPKVNSAADVETLAALVGDMLISRARHLNRLGKSRQIRKTEYEGSG